MTTLCCWNNAQPEIMLASRQEPKWNELQPLLLCKTEVTWSLQMQSKRECCMLGLILSNCSISSTFKRKAPAALFQGAVSDRVTSTIQKHKEIATMVAH